MLYRSSLGRYWYAPRTILVCSASVYRFSWQNTSTLNRPCPAFKLPILVLKCFNGFFRSQKLKIDGNFDLFSTEKCQFQVSEIFRISRSDIGSNIRLGYPTFSDIKLSDLDTLHMSPLIESKLSAEKNNFKIDPQTKKLSVPHVVNFRQTCNGQNLVSGRFFYFS